MTRDEYNYQAGMKTDLTPLLSMQLFASTGGHVHVRAASQRAELVPAWRRSALRPRPSSRGVVTAGYRDMDFVDPGVKPFRGFVGYGVDRVFVSRSRPPQRGVDEGC